MPNALQLSVVFTHILSTCLARREASISVNGCSTKNQYNTLQNITCDVAKDIFAVKFIILFLYCLIAFVGLVGNILVVWVVSRTKSIQTITNIFIANLAVSDILMCLVATPFTPVSLYMESWTLPEAVCKLLPITMAVSVYVSTLTSMAIALDRFFVIVHPFIPRMRIWLCFFIIITIWVVAVLISLPLAVYHRKQSNDHGRVWTCQEHWPKESSREVFTIVSFFLQFIVPCAIISVCYFRISLILRKRLRNKIGSGTKLRLQAENEIRRKKRTNSILIAMVAIFVICWIPLNVLLTAMDILSEVRIQTLLGPQYFTLVFFVCHLCGMSSAVYNPFLYAWMNENFKREVHRILPCFCSQAGQTHNTQQQTAGAEYTALATNGRQLTIPNPSFAEQPVQLCMNPINCVGETWTDERSVVRTELRASEASVKCSTFSTSEERIMAATNASC
ncbi:7 transmembrane receptor [Opisthorchis viverrini]|nr:7 transmembrane receptor [Opisthorchis viverrini]